ncbi:trifunctional transcriptional regulator/proline dehydrogenase/L-glutamate gamma-semialdehyde dehydrogenase [Candidatus Williamhamiltonella defendens]|uniref:Bifunctional protein PutA n=1 Tax=Candidatus Williamhamiltonella defendens TaxID=138072 RepID=A0A2D3T7B5_9ENTR|nr:trifunctional transcriptional regulator/proline dehydrogenase/L-glutamate gamma-semialdehyde dehydrogenase [Candidatus Hamiltonella defensa]ATW29617.1 trifunctional transcriptional regulator/proline dehydrogenase/L-glutamate gamma-semialdehyde dehydrogenase [Candidatus Hamiltonella defensa]ATW31593.1 trifunctional transcriptional regulator/proline dehydrogenase/L-glutamate gamma-semialdehyde dehydrogenase [Candidatus Hamiltonella defensa]
MHKNISDIESTEPIHAHFSYFYDPLYTPSDLQTAMNLAYRRPESDAIRELLEDARLTPDLAQATQNLAYRLCKNLRENKNDRLFSGIVQNLLQEFSLSSREGIALMCLAEALLRIPDKKTRDLLIRDKITQGEWQDHLGRSRSIFVNASAWGLLLSRRFVRQYSVSSELTLKNALSRVIKKSGEPLIRKALNVSIRLMGEQFVTGETIEKALKKSKKYENKGFLYSYDMLGEAALTEEDAKAYWMTYHNAIDVIGAASKHRGVYESPGISIKLSALHPRYTRSQYKVLVEELYPRLLSLVQKARRYNIGINIDAEETERLPISLSFLEKLCFEPDLKGWSGIGFVIQSYQKRCPFVIDALIDLAKRSEHRLMIRLVKGAYWDREIKHAQVEGLSDYPVYTRKPHTDISYLACARKLLAFPELIYPQFATHNAYTLASIYYLAGGENHAPEQYEFQCLNGMGEPLYQQVVGAVSEGGLNRPCRIYAPVGSHKTLLAYLVRRLLENGANTSFVNRIADLNIPLEQLIQDPVEWVEKKAASEGTLGLMNPMIPLPRDLYHDTFCDKKRANACGVDLSDEQVLASISEGLFASAKKVKSAYPIIGLEPGKGGVEKKIFNPANTEDLVGYVREATSSEAIRALHFACTTQAEWAETPPAERAGFLLKASDAMESEKDSLLELLIRETGKTLENAINEIREAVDFLRYYAVIVEQHFSNKTEIPLGPVVCISPWNFPLAIFTGQVAAALASGNCVLAKPAEQTPLIATEVVRILFEAGVPRKALQLLPGAGESIGSLLVKDPRVAGVMFTGSTSVARLIQNHLSERLNKKNQPIPFIAETGGLNAMIVDSSALTEQVVTDVMKSAFDSAGQRCSGLRILCLQEDIAHKTLHMLRGAMAAYRVGNPEHFSTDIGPVIDAQAKEMIEGHIQAMKEKGRTVYQAAHLNKLDKNTDSKGYFIKPTLIELDTFDELQEEIFGPVLHVVRFKRTDLMTMVDKINATGYGLTLGIQSRIDETIAEITARAKVGNIYVNRNMVGAVVGVQPFGGEGLSGTGPKAGGPLYLYRLLASRSNKALNQTLLQQTKEQISDVDQDKTRLNAQEAFKEWLREQDKSELLELAQEYMKYTVSGQAFLLSGPTGESNTYQLCPREKVLCLADDEKDAYIQLAAVLVVGSQVIWPKKNLQTQLFASLPPLVQQRISFADNNDWSSDSLFFDAVIYHGDHETLTVLCQQLAKRSGPIVSVQGLYQGDTQIQLERLVIERSLSINTTAAGGNTYLMTMS